jgi:O-antigen/teichoic acid export membrane protein
LPPLAPSGIVKTLAIALLFLGTWLMLAVLRGRIHRRMRLVAAWASALLAVICGIAVLSLPHHAAYVVVGAGHALFATIWLILRIVPRPRIRGRGRVHGRTSDKGAEHQRS